MNNTKFFTTCVELVGADHKPAPSTKPRETVLENKFLAVSGEIAAAIDLLSAQIDEMAPEYLLASSKSLNDASKRKLEIQVKAEINKINTQIGHFEKITQKVIKANESGLEGSGGGTGLVKNLLSFGEYGGYQIIVENTKREILNNIIKCLHLKLKSLLDKWTLMFNKRQSRISELNKSKFDTTTTSAAHYEDTKPSEDFQHLETKLSEQQLVQLQEEQHSLLESIKNQTLSQVDQIESTMMDISSMVRDINIQLSVQNDTIKELDSNEIEISSNVAMGNVDLRKANERHSKTNGMIFWTIISMALFLLFVDWLL